MKRPGVSICMATCNGEPYINDQLRSILDQMNPEDELIISDDGSTDATCRIIAELKDDRVTLVTGRQERPYGLFDSVHYRITRNFERAMSCATREVIFFSDQDDVWTPDKISVSLRYLDRFDVIVSDCWILDSSGRVRPDSFFKMKQSGPGFFKNLVRPTFHGCCMAIRKDLLPLVLPFPEHLIMHDAWIGLLASVKGRVGFIDEKLCYYRIHSQSASGDSIKSPNSKIFQLYYRLELLFQILVRLIDRRP